MMLWRTIRTYLRRRRRRASHLMHPRFDGYEIGRGSYGNPDVMSWGEGTTLRIGAFCSIASGVKIFLGGEHRMDWVTTYPFPVFREDARSVSGHPRTKGDVVIGNDVWIGHEAIVMSGVTVGDGAVIGARALVTRDVPPYGIVAGNPARLVRRRFDDATVEALLDLRWWDLDEATLSELMPLMLSEDIGAFIEAARAHRPPADAEPTRATSEGSAMAA